MWRNSNIVNYSDSGKWWSSCRLFVIVLSRPSLLFSRRKHLVSFLAFWFLKVNGECENNEHCNSCTAHLGSSRGGYVCCGSLLTFCSGVTKTSPGESCDICCCLDGELRFSKASGLMH
jgi:hypothetical protein